MNREMLFHFLKFNIQSKSLAIGEWIDRLYISNDLTATFPDNRATLSLVIENKNSPEAAVVVPPENGVFSETNLCTARCYYEEGRFFSANYGEYWHEMDYDIALNTIRANVGGKYLENGQALISHIIRPLFQSFILPFYRLKSLHGAVLTKDGQTLFLSGSGGMGKTTSSIQLMRAGYNLLSEDGPLFFTDNGSAYALSSLDYLHLTEQTLGLFPELKPHIVGEKDHREKFSVRISNLQTDSSWKRPQQITHYVELQRKPGVVSPRIKRVSRNVVHRNLVEESMVIFRGPVFRLSTTQFNGYSEFVFELLTKMVQGAETFELEYADHHLTELPDLLSDL